MALYYSSALWNQWLLLTITSSRDVTVKRAAGMEGQLSVYPSGIAVPVSTSSYMILNLQIPHFYFFFSPSNCAVFILTLKDVFFTIFDLQVLFI
jgi:hypothetical protein